MDYRENRDVRRPFVAAPDARVYFPATAVERARRATERCLRRGEGIALALGATGVGKTLFSRYLATRFGDDDITVVASSTRKTDVKAFLQQILFGLRQTFCGCDETELRLMLFDYLEHSQRRRFVLIIDDAHFLPLRVLDEARLLVEQGPALASHISVALIGANSLEERLNLPKYYSIQQRIAARSYLEPFSSVDISNYIDFELARVGIGVAFSARAKDAVFELSGGLPRVVTQICDRAVFLAIEKLEGENTLSLGNVVKSADSKDFTENSQFIENSETFSKNVTSNVIDRDAIDAAWADLQNMPTSASDTREALPSDGADDVVEFGVLAENEFESERSRPAKVDWEAERYGEVDAALAEIDEEPGLIAEEPALEDDAASEDGCEIDAELEARILEKLDASAQVADEVGASDLVATNAEEASVRVQGDFVATVDGGAEWFAVVAVANESNVQNLAETFDDPVKYENETVNLDENIECKDSNSVQICDDAQERGNVMTERFTEVRLTPDAVERRTVYADENIGKNTQNVLETETYATFEDLAQQQHAVAYRSFAFDDDPKSDPYLNELDLLEREVAQEVDLIRKIRNIHMRLRVARGERSADAAMETDNLDEAAFAQSASSK
ncbi:MAG: AAA family ATPase [Thermoguttaceae bacterium]|nr:AAA family ATPase [Thermoguttaceae bacterium]